jgi:predicted DNA-binding protein (MmcQ/YjbR family)
MTSPCRRRLKKAGAKRRSDRTPLARLRAICLALPDTTEKIAWGEPTWRVRGKLFAQLDDHHHGADPARFFRPPYVGPRGWVGVRIDRRPNWTVVAKLVKQAYHMVAAPKTTRRP